MRAYNELYEKQHAIRHAGLEVYAALRYLIRHPETVMEYRINVYVLQYLFHLSPPATTTETAGTSSTPTATATGLLKALEALT